MTIKAHFVPGDRPARQSNPSAPSGAGAGGHRSSVVVGRSSKGHCIDLLKKACYPGAASAFTLKKPPKNHPNCFILFAAAAGA